MILKKKCKFITSMYKFLTSPFTLCAIRCKRPNIWINSYNHTHYILPFKLDNSIHIIHVHATAYTFISCFQIIACIFVPILIPCINFVAQNTDGEKENSPPFSTKIVFAFTTKSEAKISLPYALYCFYNAPVTKFWTNLVSVRINGVRLKNPSAKLYSHIHYFTNIFKYFQLCLHNRILCFETGCANMPVNISQFPLLVTQYNTSYFKKINGPSW